jgi:predicted RNase H-like HicB family nuclease
VKLTEKQLRAIVRTRLLEEQSSLEFRKHLIEAGFLKKAGAKLKDFFTGNKTTFGKDPKKAEEQAAEAIFTVFASYLQADKDAKRPLDQDAATKKIKNFLSGVMKELEQSESQEKTK